jgi:hypothetical protein
MTTREELARLATATSTAHERAAAESRAVAADATRGMETKVERMQALVVLIDDAHKTEREFIAAMREPLSN